MRSDGFCKPTLKRPSTSVWFPGKNCLIVQNSETIGRMSKLNNRYWLESDVFFNSTGRNIKQIIYVELPTVFFILNFYNKSALRSTHQLH